MQTILTPTRAFIASTLSVLLTAFLPACTEPRDLEFVDIQRLRIEKWGLAESEIGLDLRLYNPNKNSVQMKEGKARIYANSTYLGEAEMDDLLTVPSRDTFAIPLSLRVPTMSTLGELIRLSADSSVLVRVEGSVRMGKAGLFRSYSIFYEEMQRFSAFKF